MGSKKSWEDFPFHHQVLESFGGESLVAGSRWIGVWVSLGR